MTPLALVLRRARASTGLLLTITLLVLTTTAIIAGTLGYSQAAATTAARQAITDATPTEAGIQAQTRLAEDAEAQDKAARAAITEAFAPAPVAIQRTVVTEPRQVAGQQGRLEVLAGATLTEGAPAFTDLVDVVDGQWPAGSGSGDGTPVAGALHAGTAEQWGVGVGDRLDVNGVPVQVVGVWRPVDPSAAYWFGDPLVATGTGEEDRVGPLVVAPGDTQGFGDAPFVRWSVQPDAAGLHPDDLPVLAEAAATLQETMQEPDIDVRGVTVEGDLAPTAASAARNLATARALGVVPVTLLLLVSVISVVQLARLLAAARTREVELFVARGATRGQLLRWSMAESLVVTVVATIAGTGLGAVLLLAVPAGAGQLGTVLRVGLLSGLAVLLVLAAVTALQVRARTAAGAGPTDTSGRARTAAALGTVLLTVGAAALAWWQLRRYGSPLVTEPDGSLSTDVVAGAAPALMLAASAVLATALLGPVGRAMEALTGPGRGLVAHLSASQVSRRLVVYAVPVVLTVLAVGATTVAGLYAASSAQLRDDLTALRQGADIRVQPAETPAGEPWALPDVSGVDGVSADAAVWAQDAQVGETDADVLMAPMPGFADTALAPDGSLDLAATATALGTSTDRGAPIEGSALQLEVTGTASLPPSLPDALRESRNAGAPADQQDFFLQQIVLPYLDELQQPHQLEATAVLLDEDSGGVQRVPAEPVPYDVGLTVDPDDPTRVTVEPTPVDGTVTVPLPAPGQRLLGLELETTDVGVLELRLTSDSADLTGLTDGVSSEEQDAGWARLEVTASSSSATISAERRDPRQTNGLSYQSVPVDLPLRLPGYPPPGEPVPVPVAVTQHLANAAFLSPGDPVGLRPWGTDVTGTVTEVVTAVPGSTRPDVVLADSTALSLAVARAGGSVPAPTALWVASSTPQPTIEALAAVDGVSTVAGPGSVSVTDAAGAVRLVFWVAAAGAVLLAATGIAAVAATSLSARRAEVSVLRALGMPPGAQARSRAAELAGVVLASVLLGLGAGLLVGWSVIPELARSTTLAGQATLPAPVRLEWPLWAGLLGAGGVVIIAVVTVQAARVRAQALDTDYREEIR